MGVLNFNDYISESSKEIKQSAGVAVVYDGKVLLVHPTNASWKKSALGIPKGGIDSGEDSLEAALRELKEETGLIIDPSKLDLDYGTANKYNSSKKVDYQLFYYIARIDNLSDIGMTSLKVDSSQLQVNEIDWAGFVDINKAYELIHAYQMIILDRLK
tara:strand:- start:2567 stop:3040 length:474 start_codon:yes stop_codon:yes gene_type:complete